MKRFIFGLEKPEHICGSRDSPDEVCEWKDVICNTTGEIENFTWSGKKAAGTLGLGLLPWSVKTLDMSINSLSGTIQLASIPEKMENFYLYRNQLTGSLNLNSLPVAMQKVSLGENNFSGEISLEQLPEGLELLYLAYNQLNANPTKGHLSVVGWTSTPVLGEAKNLFKPLVVFLSWRRPY
ncbi:hypothetical protein XU18_5209 [Perkinsela sp. CCAP 1560/4]|nr:hypothetical protein XU18_5209 [Perkinsela sp. CCAP 1560/4]|eukprot:KNH00572.1 hypothetical protein XU18_5209 [Perkinsela sp. CCAP 1560/4]